MSAKFYTKMRLESPSHGRVVSIRAKASASCSSERCSRVVDDRKKQQSRFSRSQQLRLKNKLRVSAKTKDEENEYDSAGDEIYEPRKEDLGPMIGAAGGFGGGEKGLKKFVSEKGIPYGPGVNYSKEEKVEPVPAAPIGKGKDLIYVGKPKGAKEVDDKTKYIKDDQRLYPGKDDLGGFIGVSGGFAGGEVGLKRFAETGKAEDIDLRQKGSLKGRQPQSPLAIAFGLGGTAAVGALFFDPENLRELSDKATSSSSALLENGNLNALTQSPLTLYAVGAVGALVVGGYAFNQVKKATASIAEVAGRTAVTGLFGLGVVKLALIILTK